MKMESQAQQLEQQDLQLRLKQEQIQTLQNEQTILNEQLQTLRNEQTILNEQLHQQQSHCHFKDSDLCVHLAQEARRSGRNDFRFPAFCNPQGVPGFYGNNAVYYDAFGRPSV